MEGQILYDCTPTGHPEEVDPETGSRSEVIRGWGRGGKESHCLMGAVSVWVMTKFWKLVTVAQLCCECK